MKLYDYLNLMPEGNELTVWDKDYDIEMYFYSDRSDDKWSNSIWKLTKLLQITQINTTGVIVNLSDAIERNLEKLKEKDLFITYDLEDIMLDIPNILSGNVSEEWIEQFVKVLT